MPYVLFEMFSVRSLIVMGVAALRLLHDHDDGRGVPQDSLGFFAANEWGHVCHALRIKTDEWHSMCCEMQRDSYAMSFSCEDVADFILDPDWLPF